MDNDLGSAIQRLSQPTPIRVAESVEDREAARRLRYAVFTEEQGDDRYADHVDRTFGDAWDDDRSVLLGAWDGPELVGTARLALRRHGPYLLDDLYAWDRLACLVGPGVPDGVGIVSRVCVAPPRRGRGVVSLLLDALTERAYRERCTALVLAVRVGNPRTAVWERYGFQRYAQADAPEWCGCFLFRALVA